MTWRELWLFLHVTAAMVWIGGAVAVQVFGILTKRAADPAKTAFFAGNVSFLVMRVLFPAALVVLLSGIGLKVEGHWDWGEPFIVYGLVFWALVAALGFGYLGGAIGRAGLQLASEGPSPALGFMMSTKLGT
jgi:uncharacterized membrane protein